MKRIISYAIILASISVIAGCGVYSFTGVSTEAKSYSVSLFPNRAPLVNPNLSIRFTENLKQEILQQTPMQLLEKGGDLEFSGAIVDYSVMPIAAQQGDVNSQNRLTIGVQVSFLNNLDPDQNFEQKFSRFRDYDASQTLNEVEETLNAEIIDELAQDIINKALVNW